MPPTYLEEFINVGQKRKKKSMLIFEQDIQRTISNSHLHTPIYSPHRYKLNNQ